MRLHRHPRVNDDTEATDRGGGGDADVADGKGISRDTALASVRGAPHKFGLLSVELEAVALKPRADVEDACCDALF